jgi:riboflavin synthase
MFTGLVVETGEIVSLTPNGESARLTLRAPSIAPQSQLGDSIAVNGCCLTVTARDGDRLSFDLLAVTLRITNIGDLSPGAKVNLEPALGAGAKMGGHFVQGHVDTTAAILELSPHGQDHRLEIALPSEFAQLVVFKGSIAVDGISLTVAEVRDSSFVCWIIPHTLAETNLSTRRSGDRVNLEFDMLAKYVERIISHRKQPKIRAAKKIPNFFLT